MAVLAAKGLNDKTVGFHKLTNKSRRAESNNECKITKLSLLCNKEIGDCNQRERDRTNKHGEVNRAWSMRKMTNYTMNQQGISWMCPRNGVRHGTAYSFLSWWDVHCSLLGLQLEPSLYSFMYTAPAPHNVWSFLALVHHLLYSMLAPYIIYYVGFLYLYVICPWLIENQVQVASVWPPHIHLCTKFTWGLSSSQQEDSFQRHLWILRLELQPDAREVASLVVTFRHGYAYHTYPYKHTFMDLPVMHEVQQIWTVSPRVSCTPLEPIQGSRVLLVVVGEIYR